jgi:hypothetical protein
MLIIVKIDAKVAEFLYVLALYNVTLFWFVNSIYKYILQNVTTRHLRITCLLMIKHI